MKVERAYLRRLLILFSFLIVLFAVLLGKFYTLQVIQVEKWKNVAFRQHHRMVKERGKRGVFYASGGSAPLPIVVDMPVSHLFVDPKGIPDEHKAHFAKMLSLLLRMPPNGEERLLRELNRKSRSRRIGAFLGKRETEAVRKFWQGEAKRLKLPRNALFFVQDFRRSYPHGKLLGQVLHTVREERVGEMVPTGGLELSFDRYLRGKDGKRLLVRSPRHAFDQGTVIEPPQNGADVYLTIDLTLQSIVEEELAKAVQAASAKRGWAIMMNPYSGEIMALAQYPFFPPSKCGTFFRNPKLQEETVVKSVIEPFEPGSVMKPLTVAICLQANRELQKEGKPPCFDPKEKMATFDGKFPGRSRPVSDIHRYRYLNMALGIQKSSNIYAARLVQKLIAAKGEAWYRNALQEFLGFGKPTGIEFSGECPGHIPRPGKKHKNGTYEWSTATPFSIAFGHNILVTSMQMVRSYAILANGGMDVHPRIVRRIARTDGEVFYDAAQAPPQSKRILDADISREVVNVMQFATQPGGSGTRANIPGYTEAGKTSTAEKIVHGVYSKNTHISTFIGFAPVKNPAFVLLITIDEPEARFTPGIGRNQMGGICAAPAFREIGTRALQYLGIAPDDPYGYPAPDPRRDAKRMVLSKEIEELQKLNHEWNQ